MNFIEWHFWLNFRYHCFCMDSISHNKHLNRLLLSFAEKLCTINGLSLQYTTQYFFGTKHIYLPIECIHNIVINEVIFGVSFIWFQFYCTLSISLWWFRFLLLSFSRIFGAVSDHLHLTSTNKRYSISTSAGGAFIIGMHCFIPYLFIHSFIQFKSIQLNWKISLLFSFICYFGAGFESKSCMHTNHLQIATQTDFQH